MRRSTPTLLGALLLGAGALLVAPEAALGYGGPGSVISGIGALLAAIAAVGAAIFGFFWFPMKRLYKKIRGEEEEEGEVDRDVAEA